MPLTLTTAVEQLEDGMVIPCANPPGFAREGEAGGIQGLGPFEMEGDWQDGARSSGKGSATSHGSGINRLTEHLQHAGDFGLAGFQLRVFAGAHGRSNHAGAIDEHMRLNTSTRIRLALGRKEASDRQPHATSG